MSLSDSRTAILAVLCCWLAQAGASAATPPWIEVLDLNTGEERTVTLRDGSVARVRLLGRAETRDPVANAVRDASVRVSVNNREIALHCGNYRLPLSAGGVQIDCTVTKGYLENARANTWGLEKDARLRLWPAGSAWIEPGSYVYPVRQPWFLTNTQMSNEPSFVDGSEVPAPRKIYYHYGLDVGGAEGLTEVVSATSGLVIMRGGKALPAYEHSPYTEVGYDGVIVLDQRGWFHWYFHLASIDDGIPLGQQIAAGRLIGRIGKEGQAGCWSHLHYEIRSEQLSGKPGIQEGYAFLWEAYQRQYSPAVIAVARPHAVAWVGERVSLDGSRSWVRSGATASYEWSFSDGSKAKAASVGRVYARPGTYSETLKVTDGRGHAAYDFAVVQVLQRGIVVRSETDLPPTIHAAYAPGAGLRAGQPVTFLVRTCRTGPGHEVWNFGDGSPPVSVASDGCAEPRSKAGYARTEHAYRNPGGYLVSVERANASGEKATARLHVRVGQ